METIKRQMSETFRIAALLAIVGGFLDAYTYVARGGVFANAQTGNIVLLGIAFAQGEFLHALVYLTPICAFIAGVFVDEWIRKHFQPKGRFHWRQIILIIEAIILFTVAFLPFKTGDMVSNVLISFVCSLQVQSFRTVRGVPYASTMCTGNLRSGTELLFHFTQTKNREDGKKVLWYFGIIAFFIVGAIFGVFATRFAQSLAPLFPAGLLLFICVLLLRGGE